MACVLLVGDNDESLELILSSFSLKLSSCTSLLRLMMICGCFVNESDGNGRASV